MLQQTSRRREGLPGITVARTVRVCTDSLARRPAVGVVSCVRGVASSLMHARSTLYAVFPHIGGRTARKASALAGHAKHSPASAAPQGKCMKRDRRPAAPALRSLLRSLTHPHRAFSRFRAAGAAGAGTTEPGDAAAASCVSQEHDAHEMHQRTGRTEGSARRGETQQHVLSLAPRAQGIVMCTPAFCVCPCTAAKHAHSVSVYVWPVRRSRVRW